MSQTTVTPELEAPTVAPLNAADRCDLCSAQAYVEVTFESGPLLFCGHHFTKAEEKIKLTALNIRDERHRLSARAEGAEVV